MNIDYKPSVVLIDDEANILKSLKREISQNFRADILCFSDSTEAMNHLKENHCDILIADMRMPNINGIEIMELAYKSFPDGERILLTGYSDLSSTIDIINKGHIHHYISKPWEEIDLINTLTRAIEHVGLKHENRQLSLNLKKKNSELASINDHLENLVIKRTEKLTKLYSNSIRTFASLATLRIGTNNHESLAEQACTYIGEKLVLSDEELFQLRSACALRNLGKSFLSDQLISTPFFSMTQEDKQKFERHPLLAETALMFMEPLTACRTIIKQHKERCNGSGYPNQLRSSDISISAKILSVVSDYVDLIEGRIYSSPYTEASALDELSRRAPAEYDKELVKLLITFIRSQAINQGITNTERCISTLNLTAGDKISRDLVSEHGMFILPKGKQIDNETIQQLLTIESNTRSKLKIFIYS